MNNLKNAVKKSTNPYESPVVETPQATPKEGCLGAVFLFLLVPILLLCIAIFFLAGAAISMPDFPTQPD